MTTLTRLLKTYLRIGSPLKKILSFQLIAIYIAMRKAYWHLMGTYSAAPQGKIYVSHHRPFWTYATPMFLPIQVGREVAGSREASLRLPMLGDDTGENISSKNPLYCELTAFYWVWKNAPPADFVGFFHYRRYLNFTGIRLKHHLKESDLESGKAKAEFFIDPPYIRKLMLHYDLLLPLPSDFGHRTVAQQFIAAHQQEAWDILMEVVREKHPHHRNALQQVFYEQRAAYIGNCFIMSYALFLKYMEWLFPLLEAFESRMLGSDHQGRVCGYAAERLFNLFIQIELEEGSIRLKELPWIFIDS